MIGIWYKMRDEEDPALQQVIEKIKNVKCAICHDPVDFTEIATDPVVELDRSMVTVVHTEAKIHVHRRCLAMSVVESYSLVPESAMEFARRVDSGLDEATLMETYRQSLLGNTPDDLDDPASLIVRRLRAD